MTKHASRHASSRLFLLLELFPRTPGTFHRGGSVKGVFETRAEAEAVIAQDADAIEDGIRFYVSEVQAEELL